MLATQGRRVKRRPCVANCLSSLDETIQINIWSKIRPMSSLGVPPMSHTNQLCCRDLMKADLKTYAV